VPIKPLNFSTLGPLEKRLSSKPEFHARGVGVPQIISREVTEKIIEVKSNTQKIMRRGYDEARYYQSGL
jgi:hypothetical protein